MRGEAQEVSCNCVATLTVYTWKPKLQKSLFTEDNNCEQSEEKCHSLGNDLYLELGNGPEGQALLSPG